MVGALGAVLLLSSSAYADALSPTMRIWIMDLNTGLGVILTDNAAGDADPTLGLLAFSGAVGGFNVSFANGFSQPIVGGVYNEAELGLGAASVRTTAGSGRLAIVLEDINYAIGPEGNKTLHAYVSGNITGAKNDDATFYAFASPSNQVPNFGVDDPPPASLIGAPGSLPADTVAVWPSGISFGLPSNGSMSFSDSGSTTFLTNGEYYSLFSALVLDLTGPAALSLSNLSVTVTPEPMTMLLFGTGASAAAWAKRRRRKAGQPAMTC
jgi:hypothetical protein